MCFTWYLDLTDYAAVNLEMTLVVLLEALTQHIRRHNHNGTVRTELHPHGTFLV